MRINILKTELRDIDELTPFQGDLKTLSPEDAVKLRRQIEEHGFLDPFIVWEHDSKTYILGGHQRQTVLKQMRADGEMIPKLPCNFVECQDEAQAKKIILALTSQFGAITEGGLLNFSASFGFSVGQLNANFRFPEIDFGQLAGLPGDPDTGGSGRGKLSDRFLIPPFSVLNAREGWWQARKSAWIELGIKSELGRGGGAATGGSPEPMARGYVDGRYVGTEDAKAGALGAVPRNERGLLGRKGKYAKR